MMWFAVDPLVIVLAPIQYQAVAELVPGRCVVFVTVVVPTVQLTEDAPTFSLTGWKLVVGAPIAVIVCVVPSNVMHSHVLSDAVVLRRIAA